MRRQIVGIGIIILISIVVGLFVRAQSEDPDDLPPVGNIVLPQSIYVRVGPARDYEAIGELTAGDYVQPVSINTEGTWVFVEFNEFFGWINRGLVRWTDDVDSLPIRNEFEPLPTLDPLVLSVTPFIPTATRLSSFVLIDAENAFIRSGPGRTYDILGQISSGTPIENPIGRSENNEWVLFQYEDEERHKQFGWIAVSLVEWLVDIEELPVLSEDNLTPTTTFTPSNTPTHTHTPTATFTPTATLTNTKTPTVTATNTQTSTPTDTPTSTATPSNTPTSTSTPTLTSTSTPTVTDTLTKEPTATLTATSTATTTSTFTDVPTATATVTSTFTDVPTETDLPTETELPTDVPSETTVSTEVAAVIEIPSETPSHTATVTLTSTPSRTPTSTVTNTATASHTPTLTVTNTATLSATPTATLTLTSTATVTETVTATPTATATVTVSPTASPTETDTHEPTDTPEATEDVTAVAAAQSDLATPTRLAEIAITEVPPSDDGAVATDRLPIEAIIGGVLFLLVLLYIALYWNGISSADRYADGFVIEDCPVCHAGKLHVESRQERFFGIPFARHTVRCDNCRSILRETGNRRWRYAVDRMENPDMYERYNNREVMTGELAALLVQRQSSATTKSVPKFVDDDADNTS